MARQHPQLPLYREGLAAALVARADLRSRVARAADPPAAAGLKAAAADLDRAVGAPGAAGPGQPEGARLPSAARGGVGRARPAGGGRGPARVVRRPGRVVVRSAAANDPENPLHPRRLAEVEREWPAAFAAAEARRKAAEKKPKP